MAKNKDFTEKDLVKLTNSFMDRLEKVMNQYHDDHQAIGTAVRELDEAKSKWKWFEKLKWLIILAAVLISYLVISMVASRYKQCNASLGIVDQFTISIQKNGACKQ
jgi:hypothetical protein